MSSEYILETHDLTKEIKGFVAVSKVNLRVRRGHIHALIGPNGAGKTTCFNLLTKFLTPSAGRIVFDGHDITGETPAHIARRGVIRSFQISAVFPHLTVLENVRVALQRKLGNSFHFWRSERSLHRHQALHTGTGCRHGGDGFFAALRQIEHSPAHGRLQRRAYRCAGCSVKDQQHRVAGSA